MASDFPVIVCTTSYKIQNKKLLENPLNKALKV